MNNTQPKYDYQTISEAREPLTVPALQHPILRSLTEVELAESVEKWEARFKETETDCPTCYRGWLEDGFGNWYRCGECQDGSIYTALCSRCDLNEHECKCEVSDFMNRG